MIRYARAPSQAFRALLAPGGLLAPALSPRTVAGLPLDAHLREGDHVHLYCGLTRILDAWLVGARVRASADPAYRGQAAGARLFRAWELDERGFAAALDEWVAGARVDPRYVRREGAVQAAWAGAREPWVPIDREAVLGYDDGPAQAAARAFPAVAAARAALGGHAATEGWAAPPAGKVGAELDQLAVDPDGRLVLIELKDASATSASVYYAPLQLLQYAWEWHAAFAAVERDLAALLAARAALGMSPPLPALAGGLRLVVGFGADTRSAEVRARYEHVRAVVDAHRPPSAGPVETWAWEDGARRVG